MGLAASQVRLLSLTARQHSVEYEAQRIEAQKLQLANESDSVYNKYLEALDATKVQYKVVANDGSTMYNDATFAKLAGSGFMFKVDTGKSDVLYTDDLDEIKDKLSADGIATITADDSYTLLTTLITEGYVTVVQQKAEPESGYEYTGGQIVFTDADGVSHNYDIDEEADDGLHYLYKVFEDTSVSTSTKLQEISDEIGLKKAEAEYEADMDKINAKDTKYDNKLSQLETERNAIKTEIESLETVAKENVDRTFKIFG